MQINRHRAPCFHALYRNGSVYLMVLVTTVVIATLIGAALSVQTVRLRSERASADASKARLAAEGGIEVVRAWIKADPQWRTNRVNGRWSTDLLLGEAKVNLDVTDTADGNLANSPYQSVLITASARVGMAEQIMSATLSAKPYAIDALSYALHIGGDFHVAAGGKLIIGSATASTNGALQNDSTIEGNARATTVTKAGTVYGTLKSGDAGVTLPGSEAAEAVALLGTQFNLNSNKKSDGDTFSTTANPYGFANAQGVYFVRATGDVEVRDLKMTGTLVIFAPGRNVTFNKTINISTASRDLPALVVVGNANFTTDSGTITGLIHVTGTLKTDGKCNFRGAVLAGATSPPIACDITGPQTIVYDPQLSAFPPIGYAKRVDMVMMPGSLQRVIK